MAETPDRNPTEEATPHRRNEARDRGQVALSQDLVAALSLTAGGGVLLLSGAALATGAAGLVRMSAGSLGKWGRADLDTVGWNRLVLDWTLPTAMQVGIVALLFLAVGLAAGYAQVGFRMTPKALEWNLERVSPASGFKRLLGSRSLVRTILAALKIALVGGVAANAAWTYLPRLGNLTGAPIGTAIAGVGSFLARVTGSAIAAFVALAVLDFFYQRWQHQRDLRMTKDELKQELKSTDGDPHVRSKIREIQRRMARQRMMADVPTASVVVTNPTHIAVALRWRPEGSGAKSASAPVVVAKGVDLVAERIREVAREHGVPLCEDVPLARALHARCEIGQEISADLYEAVAAVLAQVWKLEPEGSRGI
ncbi:MAG: flagellar biosynthesis protein FlhB [Planctomycetota bacterium]